VARPCPEKIKAIKIEKARQRSQRRNLHGMPAEKALPQEAKQSQSKEVISVSNAHVQRPNN
jgi:hypothetical protein